MMNFKIDVIDDNARSLVKIDETECGSFVCSSGSINTSSRSLTQYQEDKMQRRKNDRWSSLRHVSSDTSLQNAVFSKRPSRSSEGASCTPIRTRRDVAPTPKRRIETVRILEQALSTSPNSSSPLSQNSQSPDQANARWGDLSKKLSSSPSSFGNNSTRSAVHERLNVKLPLPTSPKVRKGITSKSA